VLYQTLSSSLLSSQSNPLWNLFSRDFRTSANGLILAVRWPLITGLLLGRQGVLSGTNLPFAAPFCSLFLLGRQRGKPTQPRRTVFWLKGQERTVTCRSHISKDLTEITCARRVQIPPAPVALAQRPGLHLAGLGRCHQGVYL
jgi:hypothetical protein